MTLLSRIRDILPVVGIEAYRYNIHHSDNARLYKLLVDLGIDLVLDVGANTGGYGKNLRRIGYVNDIISFEPLLSAYDVLCENARKDNKWHIAPRMAIGEYDGCITINESENSVSSSLLEMELQHLQAAPKSAYINTQEVKMARLDSWHHDLLNTRDNIFIKVDTQGYEQMVIQGAINLLKRTNAVQLEMSIVPLYKQQVLYIDLIEYMHNLGFELWSVIPGFIEPVSGRMLQMDGIFTKS